MESLPITIELYVSHQDGTLLTELLESLDGEVINKAVSENFAGKFNENGKSIADKLFRHAQVEQFNFENGIDEYADFHVLHLQLKEWGDSMMVHFIDFLYELIPGIRAQAWGYSEEDPWEFFIKYENGRAIKQEHVPWEDEQMDDNALEYIYKWWHEDLPDEIEVGLLSVEDDEDDDSEEELDDEY